jgi:hypothetical protein
VLGDPGEIDMLLDPDLFEFETLCRFSVSEAWICLRVLDCSRKLQVGGKQERRCMIVAMDRAGVAREAKP